MATVEVKLPDIGEGVTEGELVKWLVKIGDVVKADQAVAEVMTDKATVEVPTPVAGTVKEYKVKEGDMIPIESAMLMLETDGAGKAVASLGARPPCGGCAYVDRCALRANRAGKSRGGALSSRC